MKIQSNVYRDTLELCNLNGEVVKTLPFTINVTAVVDNVTKKQQLYASVDQSDMEAVGRAFIDLLEAIFGKTVTDELLDYYQDDYILMITDIAPLIVQEIFPLFDTYRRNALNARKKIKK